MILWRVAAVGAGLGLCAMVVGCASNSPSDAQVIRHARTAGEVMTQVRGPLPARAAAARVTGAVDNTVISAAAVHGTTWSGSVTLRITVTLTRTRPHRPDETSRCYRYVFAYPKTSNYGAPHAVSCPHTPAVNVNVPPLPTGVDGTTAAKTSRALNAMSPDARDDPRAIHAALVSALGADYTVTVGAQRPHFVWVRYGDQCLTARVSPAVVDVDAPRHGDDCFGG